jgi:hypothetical protein
MAARKTKPGGSKPDKEWRWALSRAVKERTADGAHKLDAIARKVVALAEAGDLGAAKEIGDRLDGRPAMLATGEDDAPQKLVIQIVDPTAR